MVQRTEMDLEQDSFDKFLEDLELKLCLAGKDKDEEEETKNFAGSR